MEPQMLMVKQMIDMQKASFDAMMNSMLMFWNQTEQMLGSFLNQAAWMPDQGKDAFRQWLENNKKACDYFKTTIDNGYTTLEEYFRGGSGRK